MRTVYCLGLCTVQVVTDAVCPASHACVKAACTLLDTCSDCMACFHLRPTKTSSGYTYTCPGYKQKRTFLESFRTRALCKAGRRAPTRVKAYHQDPPKASYRGYLGDTRFRAEPRYSNAAIDQVKEDHRRHMRTVTIKSLYSPPRITYVQPSVD